MKKMIQVLAVAILGFTGIGYSLAAESKLVELTTRGGVTQKFIFIKPESTPAANIILIAGGYGNLNLTGPDSMKAKGGPPNLPVRIRSALVSKGFAVAVIDAPSDQSEKGMDTEFRVGDDHAKDIGAVIDHMQQNAGNVPTWVLGFSMGSFSATNAAIRLGTKVHGLIMVGTVTASTPKWNNSGKLPRGVLDMELAKITQPTLAITHAKDACDATPPKDTAEIVRALTSAKVVKDRYFEGGSNAPWADACNAGGAHGLWGLDDEFVELVTAFIKVNQ